MKIKTVGRKINLKQNFIDKVEKRLDKFDRYFEDDAEATVTCSVEKDRHTAEITVRSRGLIFRSERTAPSLEAAFNDAADQIVKQITKNKNKLGAKIKKAVDVDLGAAPEEQSEHELVREKTFAVEPMSVEDAALQMDMLSHSFFIFKNKDTNAINVVYRRHDGNYGLLVPLD